MSFKNFSKVDVSGSARLSSGSVFHADGPACCLHYVSWAISDQQLVPEKRPPCRSALRSDCRGRYEFASRRGCASDGIGCNLITDGLLKFGSWVPASQVPCWGVGQSAANLPSHFNAHFRLSLPLHPDVHLKCGQCLTWSKKDAGSLPQADVE